MDFSDYQVASIPTSAFNVEPLKDEKVAKLCYLTLGLTGESGEFAEKVKKIVRDKNGQVSDSDLLALAKEMGDILWYLSQISTVLDVELDTIAKINLRKIQSRKKNDSLHGEGDDR